MSSGSGAHPGHLMIRRLRLQWLVVAVVLILIVTGVAALRAGLSNSTSPTVDQSYAGTELSGSAPGFQLVDQRGASVRLSDFRGKVVVLAFMDSHCQDVCPLTAQHLRRTYQELQPGEAMNVVFLSVNVNAQFNAVSDVAATTDKWQMGQIPSWHFLTGDEAALQAVWKAYSIQVVPQEGGELSHTPGIFVIDPQGQERWYISTPLQDATWRGPVLSDILPKRIRELF